MSNLNDNNELELPKYYLVLFLNNESNKEVDVVPVNWLTYSVENDNFRCQFMPGPYDQSKHKLLQSMIKKSEDPLPDWPDYPVEIRGRPANFKEAEERLNILKTKPDAFTTDNDESVKLQILKEKKSLTKIKTTATTAKDLKNKLESYHLDFNNSEKKKFESPSSSRCQKKKRKTSGKDKENSKFTAKFKNYGQVMRVIPVNYRTRIHPTNQKITDR
ncbi:uncharacterized protein LOC130667156 [Microplitis mediator]|uniref:uncharacterized protein LOC130667156 n=1 Tax=Microplitis mediator TaxID=375433 RepID=UPI0025575CCD|nr:uncharacterized protein LOC130667156 [Microplitis mediator]